MAVVIAPTVRTGYVVTSTAVACVALSLLLVPPRAEAQTWIPPVDLAAATEFNSSQPRPEIAVSGGGGVAIWPQSEGLGALEGASMSLAGAWGPPFELAPNEWGQREEPELAMDEAGEAVAVWTDLGQRTVVARARTPSGEWGPLETVSPEGSTYGAPDVAVGPAGEAVAVWSDVPSHTSTSGYRIEGSFRPAGGHWEPSATISEAGQGFDSYSPQVAIAPTGKIVVAWNTYDGGSELWTVQVAEREGGQWSAPKAVSGRWNTSFPKLEASSAGATVIWQGQEGEETWIEAASQVGGEWSEPVRVSGRPESFGPQIGADGDGTAIAIWSAFYGTEGDYVEGSTLPVGGRWSSPTAISGRVGLPEPEGARLAVAPNGQTLAAWSVGRRKEPFVEERFVEAASGLEGEWEEPTTLSTEGAWAVRPAVALDVEGDGAVAWWAANPFLPQATEFVRWRPGAPSGGAGLPSSNGQPSRSQGRRATARRIALVRQNKAYLELRCQSASACKGDLRLLVSPTGKNHKATAISARAVHFSIIAGHDEVVAVPLSRKGRQLVAAGGKRGFRVRLLGNQIQERSLLLRVAIRPGKPRVFARRGL